AGWRPAGPRGPGPRRPPRPRPGRGTLPDGGTGGAEGAGPGPEGPPDAARRALGGGAQDEPRHPAPQARGDAERVGAGERGGSAPGVRGWALGVWEGWGRAGSRGPARRRRRRLAAGVSSLGYGARGAADCAGPGPEGLPDAILRALEGGAQDELRFLAARAV